MKSKKFGPTFLWFVLVAGCYTAFGILHSVEHGKLLAPPLADEVAYFVDGGSRFRTLTNLGIGSFLKEWVNFPPHAPMSTLQAFFAFLFFGFKQWGPGAFGVYLVLGYLFLGYQSLKNTPALWRKLIPVFSLIFPVVLIMVQEVRPGAYWALFTAAAIVFTFQDDFLKKKKKELTIIGLLWGASILAKPSVFLVSFGILGFNFFLLYLKYKKKILPKLRRVVFFACLVFVPHFILNFSWLFEYFWFSLMSSGSDRFHTVITSWMHFNYFLTGDGGKMGIGFQGMIFIFSSFLAYFFFLKRTKKIELNLPMVLAANWVFIFIGLSLTPVKMPYMGFPLFLVAITLALTLLDQCFARLKKRKADLQKLKILVVTTTVICIYAWSPYAKVIGLSFGDKNDPRLPNVWSVSEKVADRIDKSIKKVGHKVFKGLVLSEGVTRAGTLGWFALKKGTPVEFDFPLQVIEYQHLRDLIRTVDVVVVSPRSEKPFFRFQEFGKEIIRELRSSGDKVLVGRVKDEEGPPWYIFVGKDIKR